jgi:two-component system, NarL family, response regulator YdfI
VIRLLIAAPSAVVRAGLEALAASNPAIELAGSFPDLSSVEALRPDVILAAMPLEELAPPADGLAPPIVLLPGDSPPAWTRDLLQLGVRALLSNNASAAEVLAAVEAAASGLAVLDPSMLDSLLPAAASPVSADAPVLTPRELEVLRMMAEGAANKTIAWKLNISEHTAKFHVASILGKLNAASRAEAVAIGIRKGLILI